ncbi:3718_t:CDS:2, partial [Dentiscutata erythropus]
NLHGIWFVDNSLGWHSHENMICKICKVTGILMHLRKITNHSLRHTAIQILTKLNVATDRIMPFLGHRTLNDRNSSEFNNNDKKEDHNKEYSGNQKESHDKDYGNKEESHDDGNKNEDANKKKRIPLALLPLNVESNSHNSRKSTSSALQESNNKDRNKPLNNSVMPQININNCKNISVNITIKHS